MATYVSDAFLASGITDVQTWALDVRLNYPNAAPTVALLDSSTGETVFRAAMSEDVLPEDSTVNLLLSTTTGPRSCPNQPFHLGANTNHLRGTE